jgi:cathepsin L
MKALLVLTLAVAASANLFSEREYQVQFTRWVAEHGKRYETAEFFQRFNVFKSNLDYVTRQNAQNSQLVLGMNQFSDLTNAEFASQTGCLLAGDAEVATIAPEMLSAPAPINWADKGAVNTRVKNQGSCGSCWAFSTTGSLEGAWQIAKGALLDLSEQQLVDCSGPAGNQGCNGGLMSNSFKWIGTNKGITNQAQYGYTARQGSCKTNVTSVATVSGFKALKADENDLATAIALGPVSIALAASSQAFQSYKSGVLETGCGTQLNHGVLLVGFNTDAKLGDYWIVKNSWGQTWGNNGYIWIRAFKNVCGLANTLNCYPTV